MSRNDDSQEIFDTAEGEELCSPSGGDPGATSGPSRGVRVLKKLGAIVLTAVVVLVVLGVLLYNFGSMERPSRTVKAQYEAMLAAGVAPKVERGFSIPIPGCKCHSDDPVLQMQHANRHIKDCSGCHSRGGAQAQAPAGVSGGY